MEQSANIPRHPPIQARSRLRVGAVIAVAAIVGLVAWLVLKGDDESSGTGRAEPVAADAAAVRALEDRAGHQVYWLGARPGTKYEVTQTNNGNVYIRYLPQDVPLGDERPNYLTVGSYPFKSAYATLEQSAEQEGTKSGTLPDGGIYVVSRERPNSVYVAYRGVNLQIEVFSPSATQARKQATSGKLRRVSG